MSVEPTLEAGTTVGTPVPFSDHRVSVYCGRSILQRDIADPTRATPSRCVSDARRSHRSGPCGAFPAATDARTSTTSSLDSLGKGPFKPHS